MEGHGDVEKLLVVANESGISPDKLVESLKIDHRSHLWRRMAKIGLPLFGMLSLYGGCNIYGQFKRVDPVSIVDLDDYCQRFYAKRRKGMKVRLDKEDGIRVDRSERDARGDYSVNEFAWVGLTSLLKCDLEITASTFESAFEPASCDLNGSVVEGAEFSVNNCQTFLSGGDITPFYGLFGAGFLEKGDLASLQAQYVYFYLALASEQLGSGYESEMFSKSGDYWKKNWFAFQWYREQDRENFNKATTYCANEFAVAVATFHEVGAPMTALQDYLAVNGMGQDMRANLQEIRKAEEWGIKNPAKGYRLVDLLEKAEDSALLVRVLNRLSDESEGEFMVDSISVFINGSYFLKEGDVNFRQAVERILEYPDIDVAGFIRNVVRTIRTQTVDVYIELMTNGNLSEKQKKSLTVALQEPLNEAKLEDKNYLAVALKASDEESQYKISLEDFFNFFSLDYVQNNPEIVDRFVALFAIGYPSYLPFSEIDSIDGHSNEIKALLVALKDEVNFRLLKGMLGQVSRSYLLGPLDRIFNLPVLEYRSSFKFLESILQYHNLLTCEEMDSFFEAYLVVKNDSVLVSRLHSVDFIESFKAFKDYCSSKHLYDSYFDKDFIVAFVKQAPDRNQEYVETLKRLLVVLADEKKGEALDPEFIARTHPGMSLEDMVQRFLER